MVSQKASTQASSSGDVNLKNWEILLFLLHRKQQWKRKCKLNFFSSYSNFIKPKKQLDFELLFIILMFEGLFKTISFVILRGTGSGA